MLIRNGCFHLIDENSDLLFALSELEIELASGNFTPCKDADEDFTIQTKCGLSYSPAIRKFYYSLLTNQVPCNFPSSRLKI